MKVVQCYFTKFLAYFEPYRLDVLDYFHKKGIDLPWDSFYVEQQYPGHDVEFYYDWPRFLYVHSRQNLLFFSIRMFLFLKNF